MAQASFKREDLERGFEPDSCCYVQHAAQIAGKKRLDLRVDSPPDLVLEVDITHPSLDKLAIFAVVGVPEVWRYDGERIRMLVLAGASYHRHNVTVMLTSHDMADLEQLAERMVMIDQGRIAFDGSFDRLRRTFADRRHLYLETPAGQAPRLDGARWVQSAGNRHEYVFDAAQVNIAALLAQAAAQTPIVDVETHRAPIDDVIADIYERWQH